MMAIVSHLSPSTPSEAEIDDSTSWINIRDADNLAKLTEDELANLDIAKQASKKVSTQGNPRKLVTRIISNNTYVI